MTTAEKICKRNIALGKWNKNSCYLCRKIAKDKCKLLEEINKETLDKPL